MTSYTRMVRGGDWVSASASTRPVRHKHPPGRQKTYFIPNWITLAGAVVDASGVASVVADPKVVLKFVPLVLPRAPP